MTQELVHATAVAINGDGNDYGVLITGDSGSGKSDLALRLIDRGAILISDDQVILAKDGPQVTLARPEQIAGKLEIHGLGIVKQDSIEKAPLKLCVKLVSQPERFPMDSQIETIAGIAIPFIRVYAPEVSAPIKVEIALKTILQSNRL